MTDRITDPAAPLSPEEVDRALDVARQLIKAGIPVFAAPPDLDHPGRFILPKEWQKTYPSEVNLERWKPGWALAAVGGHVGDFLDVDPRSGGLESEKEIRMAGQWPRSFGRQTTPSGGTHDLISLTGERKVAGFLPGLDLQAGASDGQGRGFVWISPTVRPSKDPTRLGQMIPYRWVEEPDLDALEEWRGQDESLEGLLSRVHAYRTRVPAQRERAVQAVSDDDPFMTASGGQGGSAGERVFTMAQAQDFLRPYLVDLQRAQIGSIEEKANVAATALSHFVPVFWSTDQAYALLVDALRHTAYDPEGPGEWRAEKFIKVLDGSRPPLDPWKAVLAPELDRSLFDPDAQPDTVAPPTSREEAMDLVDRLLAEMLTADQVVQRPAPKPLIMDVLDMDSEAWIIGPPGSRKSFVVLDMARCVATGTPWQGHRVRQGKVVYIVAEGATGFSLRVRAAQQAHGPVGGDLLILPRPVQAKDPVAWEVLVAAVRRLQPVLVILDTQARVTVGLEENSATDMGVYVEAVRKIREATEACVLTVHHSGRNGTDARGSSAIDGAQGTELRVKVEGEKSALRGALLMDKQKDMAEAEGGLPLQFQVVELGEDPETGRRLSSLVLVEPDPFRVQEYVPEPWEEELTGGRVQAQIIRVLRDQGRSVGLTKAECRRNLEERFGQVKRTTYDTAWSRVLERRDKEGDPIVDRLQGEKYGVVSLEILQAGAPVEEMVAAGQE